MKVKLKKYAVRVLALILVLFMGTSFYLHQTGYEHGDAAEECMKQASEDKTMMYSDRDGFAMGPEDADAGIIFYQGARVDAVSYAPLMRELADSGIACFTSYMPYDLAILDKDAAEEIIRYNPDIGRWYIAGHSLGGAMAASFAGENPELFEGVILLGAYSADDISDANLKVISIYGSEDKILNMDKYREYSANLPDDFTEVVIEGGCHSYFGDYGLQKGDGKPLISLNSQIKQTAEIIKNKVI
ncbi:MAG: alpha/beta hydrolase [Firmicutes bacterium]|nr:alpha/beta hydrolase [Bacillota bacterium]